MDFQFAPDLTKQDVESLLATEKFEYQGMPLPFGLSIKGRNRSVTADVIFPEKMTGETVCDIGCCYGYFCYEARRRGASRAVGIELDPDRFRHATKLQRVYQDKIELVNADFQSVLGGESFDHVLLLNVIHHLANPVDALRIIAKSTRKRCVIEFPTFADPAYRKTLPPGIPWLLNKFALVGVAQLAKIDQTYVFSQEGLRRMIMDHETPLFKKVEFSSSPMKGRLIAICTK